MNDRKMTSNHESHKDVPPEPVTKIKSAYASGKSSSEGGKGPLAWCLAAQGVIHTLGRKFSLDGRGCLSGHQERRGGWNGPAPHLEMDKVGPRVGRTLGPIRRHLKVGRKLLPYATQCSR